MLNKLVKPALCVLLLFLLMTRSNIAREAASNGIEMCIYTVIPSLFPFIFASTMLNHSLQNFKLTIMRPISTLCKAPERGKYILLGLLGGYPVGAKCINDDYKNGHLSKSEGERLLGFCSNAGPSFIFGVVGVLFEQISVVWALWGIHIGSAILVGVILPAVTDSSETSKCLRSGPDAITTSVKAMSVICAWVVIFKIILTFCDHLLLSGRKGITQILLGGFLEITNGCISLKNIANSGLRFILAAVFLGSGGICVAMQTVSVTRDIGSGAYFIGKVIQTLISFLSAYILQLFIFPSSQKIFISNHCIISIMTLLVITVFLTHKKKVVAFLKKMRYTVVKI